MSSIIEQDEVPCNFEELLVESGSEDEGDTMECLEVDVSEDVPNDVSEDVSVDVSMDVSEYELDETELLDDFRVPACETIDSASTIRGQNTAEKEKLPLRPSSSPPSALLIPSHRAVSSSAPATAAPLATSSPKRPKKTRRRSRAPRSSTPTLADNEADARQEVEYVVTVQEDDDDNFHLADEHHVYPSQVVEHLDSRVRGCRKGRGPRRGGRARGATGRAGQDQGESQWRKGDRVVEVNMNDEDVPEELRAMVAKVVNAREAARERAVAKARKQRRENEKHDQSVEGDLDADFGQDEALFAGTEIPTSFEWSSMHDYSGKREQFLPKKTGPVNPSKNAYEAFRQYWDDGILSHIVTETNRYAQGIASSSANFAGEWYDTNVHEILVLFSFWMMLGIIKMPSTKSCFTLNPLLQTNIFRKMFSRSRYCNLCRALHFSDNSKRLTDDAGKLCFGPILDHLNSRFMEAYIPSQNICIDESLTLWKGNLKFRQYIKTKAAKFGVKTFELCESATGYLWSFFVYLGSNTTYDPAYPSTLLKSTATVLKLIRPLLNKGYTLFMDNWFNSPLLARFLKAHKTDCVGTLRASRSHVPPLISLCQLKQGQIVARHAGDITVMAYQDKKRKICTISSYHGIEQDRMESKDNREYQFKPQLILDYNKGMGGVDRKDQMLEPYLLERKRCHKWNMKLFKRLLNCSILNARIHLAASITTIPKEHIVFRLELVDQILQTHHKYVPRQHGVRDAPTASPSKFGVPVVPMEKHFAARIPKLDDKGCIRRRRCRLCGTNNSTRNKRTSYWCNICVVPLCLEPCFANYHSKPPESTPL